MIPHGFVGDLALQWTSTGDGAGLLDMVFENDDLATDEGLRTAVILSLFTDRRANDDDPLPSGDDDKRGWWGDEFQETEGDRIGSRLWLLDRGKLTNTELRRAEQYAREALAWLLEDRVATRVDAVATASGQQRTLTVDVYRPTGDRASFRFGHVWEGEALRAV